MPGIHLLILLYFLRTFHICNGQEENTDIKCDINMQCIECVSNLCVWQIVTFDSSRCLSEKNMTPGYPLYQVTPGNSKYCLNLTVENSEKKIEGLGWGYIVLIIISVLLVISVGACAIIYINIEKIYNLWGDNPYQRFGLDEANETIDMTDINERNRENYESLSMEEDEEEETLFYVTRSGRVSRPPERYPSFLKK